MRVFAHARPLLAAVAVVAALAGTAACDGGGGGTALPSTLPSIERTGSRDAAEPTKTTAEPAKSTAEPTRTTAESTKTAAEPTKTARPTRTTDEAATGTAEPTRTTDAPEPDPTTTAAAPKTTEPTQEPTTEKTTAAATTTATSPSASPSAVAVTTTDDGISGLGWLLILLVVALGILIAVLLVNRNRRTAAWATEAAALANQGRGLIATRLPAVLSTRVATERALAWPPVRADLTETGARWADLTARATDDYHRDAAGQISVMTQDLIAAVDAENQALASGHDWQRLSPQVDQIVQALDAALSALVAPQPDPNATTGQGPEPYPA